VKILVTGATGFLGRHLVPALLSCGHQITVAGRDQGRFLKMPWIGKCRFAAFDIHHPSANLRDIFGEADAVVHLAWPGLPNYKDLFHYEVNLPADYEFIKSLVLDGYSQFLITGTCFEYGMKSGCLSEEMETLPANPYALAKDTLRKFLEMLQTKFSFTLQWARLFYMYGEGQNPNSLLAMLDRSIDRGDSTFNMSGGEQLRDYLHVCQVVEGLASIVEKKKFNGIINICSGKPISVRKLVEMRIAERQADIQLNLGYYPYPDYEPMAFWGNRKRLDHLMGVE